MRADVQHVGRGIAPAEIKSLMGLGSMMLDIGVNNGDDSFLYLQLMQGLTLFAFEPEPTAIATFKSKNVFADRCRLFELALGNTIGRAVFHRSSVQGSVGAWNYSGSICKPTGHLTKHPWCEFKNTMPVDVVTLDAWATQHLPTGEIPFIKADVQGAERLLIEGGLTTLKRVKYFYTEYDDAELYEGQPTLSEILEMAPWFIPMVIFDNNVLLKNVRVK